MKTFVTAFLFALPLALFAEETPMATAAGKFLASLDADQKTKAELPFQGDERENFHFTPRVRAGLPLKAMTAPQREAAMTLLDAGMSEKGKLKIGHIMSLEGVLAELENNPKMRDPDNYYVAIFGKPGDPAGWAWRFEGHHVSVNITLVEGKGISVTPSFLGSNPAEVRDGRHKGLRALAAEEDLARTLVSSLLAGEKKTVIFSDKPPSEVIAGENRTATTLEPVGILASEMTEAQRTALFALISEYTGRYRSEVAATDIEKVKAAGTDKVRFGWAGGTKPGEAYYYRIQGPTFLMECANVQNNANHIHAAWRDFTGDFGRDLLREHYSGGEH
jgi:hypothetical protein